MRRPLVPSSSIATRMAGNVLTFPSRVSGVWCEQRKRWLSFLTAAGSGESFWSARVLMASTGSASPHCVDTRTNKLLRRRRIKTRPTMMRCFGSETSTAGPLDKKNRRNPREDQISEKETELLDQIGAEGRRILAILETLPKGETNSMTSLSLEDSTAFEIAADDILQQATWDLLNLTSNQGTPSSVPLAGVMGQHATDDRVVALHRAFLETIQQCLAALPTPPAEASTETSVSGPWGPEDPVPLTCIVDLSIQAHSLGLPFHIPLYKSIVTSIAQHTRSPYLIVGGMVQIAQWLKEGHGNDHASLTILHDVFHPAFVAIAERNRLDDLKSLLDSLARMVGMVTHPANTVQAILMCFREAIWTHWNLGPESISGKPTMTEATQELLSSREQVAILEDVVQRLEPSIWSIFGYQPVGKKDHAASLRDALEVLLTVDEQGQIVPWEEPWWSSTPSQKQPGYPDADDMMQALLSESPDLIHAIFPEEQDLVSPEEDEDDEVAKTGAQNKSKSPSSKSSGKWEFHVETNEDVTIVGVTRVFLDDEDNVDADTPKTSTESDMPSQIERDRLYQGRRVIPHDLPDILPQFDPYVPGIPRSPLLKYSASLEKSLHQQLFGMGPFHRL